MTIRVGDLELISLMDGHIRLDGGAMFGTVPKVLWQQRAAADDRNRVTLAMRPLLVRGERLLLIDAGVGDVMSAKQVDIFGIDRREHLEVTLAREGLQRKDIDLVIASHLHFDHAGGFATREPSGAIVPAFPRARYRISHGEWEDATHPHERSRASYLPDTLSPLVAAGVVDFHSGDESPMAGVRVRRTGGHTRFHQIVYLESGGRTAVFAADLLPTTAHLDLPWIMGFDLYPVETLEFKRAFLREVINNEYLVFFEHDPVVAAGYVREVNGKRYVEAVGA